MAVGIGTSFTPSLLPASTPSTPANSATMSKDDFLKLFLTSLQDQDPQQAQDPTQFQAQLAQFSSLEQMTNLNTAFSAQSSIDQLNAAAGMIGKSVTTLDSQGNAGSGVVQSVRMQSGQAMLVLPGQQTFPLSSVTTVNNVPYTPASGG